MLTHVGWLPVLVCRSRYWRLYMDDNFGGSSIRIREVRLLGPDEVGVMQVHAIRVMQVHAVRPACVKHDSFA